MIQQLKIFITIIIKYTKINQPYIFTPTIYLKLTNIPKLNLNISKIFNYHKTKINLKL